MARTRNPIPTYRKKNDRGVVSVYDCHGIRHDILLPGPFGTEESRKEYGRILVVLNANDGCLPTHDEKKPDLSVNEIILRFITEHVHGYYIDPVSKQPTSEQICIKAAMRPLKRLFGDLPATEFGPLKLQKVRDAMVDGTWLTEAERSDYLAKGRKIGLARSTVNKNVNRIKLLFRWATQAELIPANILHGLDAVAGLRRGRSAARETDDIKPVPLGIIDETIPFLPPVVKDMVELLVLSGMRIGECCAMRATNIDMVGDIWLYHPEHHKNLHRGHNRVIPLGPKSQSIIKKYLKPKIDAYLFSPAEQDKLIKESKRVARKTPLFPSHVAHQIAKRNTRQHGLEASRAVLGHKCVQMSAHYSGIDTAMASKVMAEMG